MPQSRYSYRATFCLGPLKHKTVTTTQTKHWKCDTFNYSSILWGSPHDWSTWQANSPKIRLRTAVMICSTAPAAGHNYRASGASGHTPCQWLHVSHLRLPSSVPLPPSNRRSLETCPQHKSRRYIYWIFFFWLLLTVHLSIFISVFNQLDAQNLFHNKFYFMPLHVSSTCSHHLEVKIVLNSLWYHHTYRCGDTRDCVMVSSHL